MTRSGFIALAGRPNVGKSTLVNAIVGRKVAIVSDKPQTTRRAIRGVATGPPAADPPAADPAWQLVIVDLPGVQRPRDVLTERMQRRVEQELGGADAALVVLDGAQGVGGAGDRFIAAALAGADVPIVAAVNKVDRLDRAGEDLQVVRGRIWVETESQKGILVGAGGRMVKAIGTAARREIEARLGTRVHLDLSVRVRRRWRADEGLLDRLGID